MQKKTYASNPLLTLLKNSFKSTSIAAIISLIFLLLISFAIIKINKHESFYPLIGVIVQCLPAFLSGRIISKKYNRSLLLLGLLQGIVVSAFFLAISFIFYNNNLDLDSFLKSLPYIISSSVLGSVTSVSSKKKL